MAKNEYFSHYAPDGTSPWYWFDQSGYKYVHAGENLAIHFTDSSEVVDAWMDSPTHRANIVNGNFTEIGVGTAKGTYQGYDTVYVVQLFGAPAAAPVVKSATVPTPEKPKVTPAAEPVAVAQESESTESVLAATEDVVTKEVTALEESSVEEASAAANPSSSTAPLSNDVVVIESELVATSTGLAPATSTASSTEDVQHTFGTIVTKPNFLLQLVYLFLGLVVVSLLMFSVVSEVRKLHYVQAVYGVGLLILMTILWYIHSVLTTGALII
jgi:Cysteine-rich secretory protein family